MLIYQSRAEPTDETLTLSSRLEQIVHTDDFPIVAYDPILASHIGPECLGMVIYEGLWR